MVVPVLDLISTLMDVSMVDLRISRGLGMLETLVMLLLQEELPRSVS